MPEPKAEVLGVISDLIFTVKIMEAVKKFQARALFVKDPAVALVRLRDHPALVIFDLNYDAADPLGIIAQMKADPALRNIPTLGYVSHVQVQLRKRAEETGCDVVVPRSAFVQNLPDILARYLPKLA